MGALWLQQSIVIVAVLMAAVYCLWRFMPRTRMALGHWLDRDGRPSFVRRLGAALLPSAGASCDDGCGSCGQCAPSAPRSTVQVVRGPISRRPHDAVH